MDIVKSRCSEMVEAKEKQAMTEREAHFWGLMAVIGQGLYDLYTIRYPAIVRDLFVGIFVGFGMYWTSVLVCKFRSRQKHE